MSRRRLSDEQEKAIQQEIAAGTVVEEIASKFGISERTVYRRKAAQTKPHYEQTLAPNQASALLKDPTATKAITDHLGDLPNWKRNHVAARVAELAQSVFMRPGQRRPETVTKELNKARLQLRSLLDHLDQVGEDAWMYALADVLWEESADRGHLQDLLMKLDKANEIALAAQRGYGKKPSGRYRDPRIGQFITALAVIYLQETGKSPRHTTDPENGHPKSDFNHFAEACIHIFYPAELINWTAIREQMRFVTAIDWDAFTANPNAESR